MNKKLNNGESESQYIILTDDGECDLCDNKETAIEEIKHLTYKHIPLDEIRVFEAFERKIVTDITIIN